jgi:hypothetical protein
MNVTIEYNNNQLLVNFHLSKDYRELTKNETEKLILIKDKVLDIFESHIGVFKNGSNLYKKKITYIYNIISRDEKLIYFLNSLTNKQITKLEELMGGTAYSKWTIESLRDSAIKRNYEKAGVMKLSKEELVKLLEDDDNGVYDTAEETQVVEDDLDLDGEDETTSDEDETQLDLENEAEPEEKSEPASKKEKKPSKIEKTKVTTSNNKTKGTKNMATTAKKTSTKTNSNNGSAMRAAATGLNDKLKKKNLWVKGAQFLSSDEKLALLNAKTPADQKKIYKIIDKKMESVAAHSATNMKARIKANGGKPLFTPGKKKVTAPAKKIVAPKKVAKK